MEKLEHDGFDRRKIIGVFVIVALCAIPFGGYKYFEHRSAMLPLPIGSVFPSSSLTTLSRMVTSTDSVLNGRCLVAWISTECALCRAEILTLDRIRRMEGNCLGIVVISLNSHRETEIFRKNLHVTVPIYVANRDEARKTYHIYRLPTLFFIDEHKKIRSIVSTIAVNNDLSLSVPSILD